MTTTTGKLIGMIKFSLLVSGVLAFWPGASYDFEKRSLEGSKRRLLRRVMGVVCFLRRSAPNPSTLAVFQLQRRLWSSHAAQRRSRDNCA